VGSARKRAGRIIESVGILESFRWLIFFFDVRCLLEAGLAARVVEEAGSPGRKWITGVSDDRVRSENKPELHVSKCSVR